MRRAAQDGTGSVGRRIFNQPRLLQSAHELMAELLCTLSADDQATLALAMRVAMPLLQQLTRGAAQHPQSEPAAASLTS